MGGGHLMDRRIIRAIYMLAFEDRLDCVMNSKGWLLYDKDLTISHRLCDWFAGGDDCYYPTIYNDIRKWVERFEKGHYSFD